MARQQRVRTGSRSTRTTHSSGSASKSGSTTGRAIRQTSSVAGRAGRTARSRASGATSAARSTRTARGAAGRTIKTTRTTVKGAYRGTLGGLGVGIAVRINAADLKQTLNNLKEVVTQQLGPVSNAMQAKLWDLRDQLMRLRQAAEEGAPEIRQAYRQVLCSLRSAAAEGKEQARQLLNRLGESEEEASEI